MGIIMGGLACCRRSSARSCGAWTPPRSSGRTAKTSSPARASARGGVTSRARSCVCPRIPGKSLSLRALNRFEVSPFKINWFFFMFEFLGTNHFLILFLIF